VFSKWSVWRFLSGTSLANTFLTERAACIVPFERNGRFTGRQEQLATLEQEIFGSNQTPRTALVGLGGVGKTQVALELVYELETSIETA
jgi:Cdc6-like AAA superfamily ATPase